MLLLELEQHQERLAAANCRLREFAATAPLAEREARAVLDSIPNVGPVTIDVILAELCDWRRFRSQAHVGAKKAIVAIARRLLGMIFSLLRTGQKYALAREAA